MSEGRKKGTGGYKLDIIVLLLFVILLLVDKLWFSRVSYISGLKGGSSDDLMAVLLVVLLYPVFLGLIVIALIRLIAGIWKVCKRREGGRGILLLSVASLVAGGTLVVGFFGGEAGAVDFVRGYEKWVQEEVDIGAIQEWLMSVDSGYSEKRYSGASHPTAQYVIGESFPEELPAAIKKLEVQYMYFGKFTNEERSVEFEWGGAMGHWGIHIGLPGMETPEEGVIEIDGSMFEFRRPVQPGVYVFDRG